MKWLIQWWKDRQRQKQRAELAKNLDAWRAWRRTIAAIHTDGSKNGYYERQVQMAETALANFDTKTEKESK